jgi:hypothetical protein
MTKTTPPVGYRPPTWVRRALVNPVARSLVLCGHAGGRGEQNLMRVLRVPGRNSGRLYDVPLRIAVRDGDRYVVSLTGQTEWARNLRAAAGGSLVYGDRTEPVAAVELGPDEKVDFLRWYCTVPAHRLSVRAGLRLNPRRPTPEGLIRAAREHPVFRLMAAPGT